VFEKSHFKIGDTDIYIHPAGPIIFEWFNLEQTLAVWKIENREDDKLRGTILLYGNLVYIIL
jgi:hypothetical protein